jgi:hypothetical protein
MFGCLFLIVFISLPAIALGFNEKEVIKTIIAQF